MARKLIVTDEWVIPAERLQITFARSGGPGGQNVNKVNSKAVLRWSLTKSEEAEDLPADVLARFRSRYGNRINQHDEAIIAADENRDQVANVRAAYSRLRQMLLSVAKPPKQRRATRPSRGAIQRRLESKQRHGEKKRRRRPPKSGDE